MTTSLDLDRYFSRIEWGGDTTPTYATLAGLLFAHLAHIPYRLRLDRSRDQPQT
jgi:N-hydroxyarylamine O-acetyltransferase